VPRTGRLLWPLGGAPLLATFSISLIPVVLSTSSSYVHHLLFPSLQQLHLRLSDTGSVTLGCMHPSILTQADKRLGVCHDIHQLAHLLVSNVTGCRCNDCMYHASATNASTRVCLCFLSNRKQVTIACLPTCRVAMTLLHILADSAYGLFGIAVQYCMSELYL
jgi:hypothetical protein